MKLVPLFDRVVLEHVKAEETTKSGIILATDEDETRTCQCEVLNCGPEVKSVKAGDIVIADRYKLAAIPVEMFFCNEDDLLAIVAE